MDGISSNVLIATEQDALTEQAYGETGHKPMNLKQFIAKKVEEFDSKFDHINSATDKTVPRICNADCEKSYSLDDVRNFLTQSLTETWEKATQFQLDKVVIAHEEGFAKGYADALEKVEKIMADELVMAHTTQSGKTSRLTSALNKIFELKINAQQK